MTMGGVVGALARRCGMTCAAVTGLRPRSSKVSMDWAVVGRAVISGDAGRRLPGRLTAVPGLADG